MDDQVSSGPAAEGDVEHVGDGNLISLGGSTFFKGCNIYHMRSVIRQRVNFASNAERDGWVSSSEFKTSFLERFQGLPAFAPTRGQERTIEERLFSDNGVRFGEILLEAILAVDAAVALRMRNFDPMSFAIAEEQTDHINLVWETASPRFSRQAAEVGFAGVLELLQNHNRRLFGGRQSDFQSSLDALLNAARNKRMSQTASLMKYVAGQRGLPVKVIARDQLRIGQGRAQRHIVSSLTDATSILTHKLCQDKRLANRRMMELRLPAPIQARVNSVDEAREAADRLEFPVVMKPLKGRGGYGVTSDIRADEEIEPAFLYAKEFGPNVLVEKFVPGFDHRLLVIGGKFSGAIRRQPPVIVGDGEKTVRELIDDLNSDPFRDGLLMNKVKYDHEMERTLERAGLGLESVIAEGAACQLRLVSNVALGGIAHDCSDFVHQDNRELVERAARGFGLDVAGIDFITPDICRSHKDVGGQIIEVNARPGLLMHMWPRYGTSRNVGGEVLGQLYPANENGRIPIVVVAGDRGTGTAARIADQLLRGCGKSTGLSLRESSYVNGKDHALGDHQQRLGPESLLRDPDVETLVSAISLRRIAQQGFQLEHCSVAIILDRHKDGNADQFHTGTSVLERATADVFVVGCGNQLALEHLKDLGKRKLILVGSRVTDPLAQEHLARGDTIIADGWTDDGDRIVLMTGEREIARFQVDESWSRLRKGRERRLRQATKYAIAAAFGLGIPVPDIAAAVESIRGD